LFKTVECGRNGAGRQSALGRKLAGGHPTSSLYDVEASHIGTVDSEVLAGCVINGIDGVLMHTQRLNDLSDDLLAGIA
jgi:hypothetical protein